MEIGAAPAHPASLCVCLLVVMSRGKRAAYGTPPELDTSALDAALGKLAHEARRRGATVHSPRLPSGGGGGNVWYAVERLLRKHMKRVATTVYYFKR